MLVGDNLLDVARRQVRGFRDYPDTGFGSVGACDHSPDVGGFDFHRGALLGVERASGGDQANGDAQCGRASVAKKSCSPHIIPPQCAGGAEAPANLILDGSIYPNTGCRGPRLAARIAPSIAPSRPPSPNRCSGIFP